MLRKALVVILLGLVAAGCGRAYQKPVVEGLDRTERLYGIEEILARDEVTELDVVLIHGMCTHGKGWARDAINRIGLNCGFIEEKLLREDLGSPVHCYPAVSKQKDPNRPHTTVYTHKFEKDGKRLWVHVILWSPATEPLKKKLCYDVTDRKTNDGEKCRDAPKFPYKRAELYANFKDKLMNNCLPDVFIYLGEQQKEIQKLVAAALVYAAGSRATLKADGTRIDPDTVGWDPVIGRVCRDQTPIFIIAESLGCKVFFDTLSAIYAEIIGQGDLGVVVAKGKLASMEANCPGPDHPLKTAVKNLFRRTQQVYLGGNQLPALSLANASHLKSLIQDSRPPSASGAKEPKLTIAAFTDPNDILAYTLKGSTLDEFEVIQAVDVVVSNGYGYFRLIDRPMFAHDGYHCNVQVRDIVRCGYPKWSDCPPRPLKGCYEWQWKNKDGELRSFAGD
jgi:hypothetical protein